MSADQIKNFRTTLGWTQEELASKLGVTQESVCQWELGKRTPGRPVLMLLSLLKEEISEFAKK